MEAIIAIGLGLWFVITGAVSTIVVFKSFKNNEEGEN